MKTGITLKIKIFYFAVLMCLMSPTLVHSQISTTYVLTNNTTCTVSVDYSFYDNTCTLLSTVMGANLNPGGNPITTPTGTWDIEITVIHITNASCPANQAPAAVNSLAPGTTCGGSSSGTLSPSGFGCLCTLSSIVVGTSSATIN